MTLRQAIPAAAILLATLVPPEAGAIDASGPGPDLKALQQRIDQWLDGYNQGDVARMMDVFSADFTDEIQGTPGELDKARMSQAFKVLFAKYRTEIDGVTDELRVSGDMAFDRGHYTITLTPKSGGANLTQYGHFLEVWKRDGGTWKVQHIVDMHDPAPAPDPMRAWPLAAAIASSLLLAALTCAAVPAEGSGPDQALIKARMGQWVDGYNRADLPAVLDVLSDDYVEDTQGLPGSTDKRQMAQAFTHIFAKYHTHVVCVLDQVYASGNMGFDRGHYIITYVPKEGGPTVTEQGRYVEMWSLEDGVWRVRYVTSMPEPLMRPVAVM